MTKIIVSVVTIAGALALAGCASHPCRNALSYRQAEAHVPPVIPAGLKNPPADPAYQIPPGKVSKAGPASPGECVVFPPQVIDPNNPPETAG
ncbi:MAG TPA: hypothetical protein VFH57_00460 [Gammaproteobacteria bacterium]|nr:hypothetical protein [Gammaproteobacteria bacterium]